MPFVARLDDDFVAAVEQHERAVAGALARDRVGAVDRLGQDALRLGRVAERARAGEHVGKRVA